MQRRTAYGPRFPVAPQSETTVIALPLTGGVRNDVSPAVVQAPSLLTAWDVRLMDGRVTRRSHLSSVASLDTTGSAPYVGGMFEFYRTNGAGFGWISRGTYHYSTVDFPLGFSAASFTSAYGIGSIGSGQDYTSLAGWQGAVGYSPALNDNCLFLATSSKDTLLCAYFNTTAQYSYVTGAPQTQAVTVFDDTVLVFNTYEIGDGGDVITRVRWSDRGDPFEWDPTNTNAGFADLTQMVGTGTAIKVLGDRLILFSDKDVWTGHRTVPPFNYSFQEMEKGVGCPYPRTIQETPLGLVWLDTYARVRLLPKGGGETIVLSGPIDQALRSRLHKLDGHPGGGRAPRSWAHYDPRDRTYSLYPTTDGAFAYDCHVFHLDTGAWTRDHLDGTTAAVYWEGAVSGGGLGPVGTYSARTTTEIASSTSIASLETHGAELATGPLLPADARQKIVNEVRVLYDATSASTATVHLSGDYGATSAQSVALRLPAASYATVATAWLYGSAQAPVVTLESASTGYRIHGVQVVMQMNGQGA